MFKRFALIFAAAAAAAALLLVPAVASAKATYGIVAGSKHLKQPRGMAVRHTNEGPRLVVADTDRNQVLQLNPAGPADSEPVVLVGGGIVRPGFSRGPVRASDIALDAPHSVGVLPSGQLVVADKNHVLVVDGDVVRQQPLLTAGEGHLEAEWGPAGEIKAMGVNPQGDILVAYTPNRYSRASLMRISGVGSEDGPVFEDVGNDARNLQVIQIASANNGDFLVTHHELHDYALSRVTRAGLDFETLTEKGEWTGGQAPSGKFIFMHGANHMYRFDSLSDAMDSKKSGEYLCNVSTGFADMNPNVLPVADDIAFVTLERAPHVYFVFDADERARMAQRVRVGNDASLRRRAAVKVIRQALSPHGVPGQPELTSAIRLGKYDQIGLPSEMRDLLKSLDPALPEWHPLRAKLITEAALAQS